MGRRLRYCARRYLSVISHRGSVFEKLADMTTDESVLAELEDELPDALNDGS